MELIHSADVSKVLTSLPKTVSAELPVASSHVPRGAAGFQLCQMFKDVLGVYENQQGSEQQDWKPLLLALPKFSSWFPMTPLPQLQLCYLSYLLTVLTFVLVFKHLTWLKMLSNILIANK